MVRSPSEKVIIIRDKCEILDSYKCVSSRIVWVTMEVGCQRWVVVCVYAPTKDNGRDDLVTFWNLLETVLHECKVKGQLVITGDMNAN